MVDEETAPVVELIFRLCAEGNGPRAKIARMLREQGILRRVRLSSDAQAGRAIITLIIHAGGMKAVLPIFWSRMAYLGRTTNFKTTKLSYKSKKTIENPPDKWVVFEDTHKAIIDPETWEIVQRRGNSVTVPPKWEKWECSLG